MKNTLKPLTIRSPKRQGRLLAFGMTGAMALAMTACSKNDGQVMVAPPKTFDPKQVPYYGDTNQPPSTPYVYGAGGSPPYLTSHGYYRIYGYPNYYWKPAPGTTVELVTGGSSGYRAGSPAEAEESARRGGFGESGGEGEGGHGSSGHGGGGE